MEEKFMISIKDIRADISEFFSCGFKDRVFRLLLLFSALTVVLIIVLMVFTLIVGAFESIKHFKLDFLVSDAWDYRSNNYGAKSFIYTTFFTSITAILISIPFSLSISLFLGAYLKNGWFSGFIKSVIELLGVIPSVIYGFWGYMFLSPVIRETAYFYGFIESSGYGVFTASIILAIMIIPYSASIGRDAVEGVDNALIEGAYSLGASRTDIIIKVIFPKSASGIFAGIVVSFGRALGEGIAVTMLIGNVNAVPGHLFDSGNTLAGIIVNEFNQAGGLQFSSMVYLGLILMIITFVANSIGRFLNRKMFSRRTSES